jgi:Na+-transporting NADH:ubiquinone oxidoreductase subunit C
MPDLTRALGWTAALAGLASAPAHVVVASEYLSVEEAQKALFPEADGFQEVALPLTPAQRAKVAELAGAQPPHRSLRAWEARHGDQPVGYVFIDEVIGKEDFITYAAGIELSGQVRPIELLAYRESHGGEIRSPAWRRQFAGRRGLEQLHVATDIKNIAGATLSCEHVTAGVRWIRALWQVALQPAAGAGR